MTTSDKMAGLPIPDYSARDIYRVAPEFFKAHGVELLLLDLDNTLAPYSRPVPTPELSAWVDALKSAGVEPFILSNNHGDRPQVFASALRLNYKNPCHKPSTKALFQVLETTGVEPSHCAILGDQIYTDVACGTRAGILSLVVKPISLKNPFHLLRYIAELPFRALARHRL